MPRRGSLLYKRLIASSLIILASSLAFGAANDTLVSFSTPGPDKYADGTTVKDGECYALVWTKTGVSFAGFAADGSVVDAANSAVLVCAPVAKAGRCPTVVFELDADLASAYSDGSFGVYLLDTRLANGKVGGVGANGLPVAVNGYGAASGSVDGGQGLTALPAGDSDGTVGRGGLSAPQVSVTTKSAIPANAPKPQITSIRVVGANVILTVKNTLPCLQYAASEAVLSPTPTSTSTSNFNSSAIAQGAATTDEEITIVVPKKGDSGFFTVGRE